MEILHISDTHVCHRRLRNLPEADVIVHSGDFTMNGSEDEALDFMDWFLCALPQSDRAFIFSYISIRSMGRRCWKEHFIRTAP